MGAAGRVTPPPGDGGDRSAVARLDYGARGKGASIRPR